MNLSVLILCIVFALVAARRVGRMRVSIWQAMTGGATAVLLTGQISPQAAWQSLDLDVLGFLLGMFVVGQALVASGYLYYLAYQWFSRVHSCHALVGLVLVGGGLASALLMNDTLAIVGTPLVLRLAREHEVDETLMLLALAFAVTLGSIFSPIGNPQNLLIATSGMMAEPFQAFLPALGPPTLLNLGLAYVWLRWVFKGAFHDSPLVHEVVGVWDADLARWAKLALILLIILVIARILLTVYQMPTLPLSGIALVSASPIVLFSRRRWPVLRQLDWATLLFFASLFVLMASVWGSGFFQGLLLRFPLDVTALPVVLGLGVGVSQLISNVPLVALYLPLLEHAHAGQTALLALAAGSTIAGNLLILGAASNVIIIQHAEKHGASLGFFRFARVGIPLTLGNGLVYWGWLEWVYPVGM